MDALGRRLGRIAIKLTGTRGKFIDVITVLNGNIKHARAIEFHQANILAMLFRQ